MVTALKSCGASETKFSWVGTRKEGVWTVWNFCVVLDGEFVVLRH